MNLDFIKNFEVPDACGRVRSTGEREPPSAVATVIGIVVFLKLILSVSRRAGRARRRGGLGPVIVALLLVGIECGAFYVYFLHYQKCRATKGFIIYAIAAFAVSILGRVLR